MTSTINPNVSQTFAKHQDNMMAALARRIEAAQAVNDLQLMKLLEQERQQIAPTTAPHRDRRSLSSRLKAFKQRVAEVLFGGTELQVYQYEQGSDQWWYAFDPQTGECVYADSEAELRLWIEQNYQGR